MDKNKVTKQRFVQILIAFLLGAGIIYWLYKDFDFTAAWSVLKQDMKWSWMLFSLLFGIVSHVIRGLRWRVGLSPLHVYPKKSNCINAIFVSYFTNMIIPRIGELSRCVVLKKYEKIPFSTSLGSVVAERFVDSICMVLLTLVTVIVQYPLFQKFFHTTGVNMPLSNTKMWLVLAGCLLLIFAIGYYVVKRFSILNKIRSVGHNIWEGFIAIKKMGNKSWTYLLYTILIWVCYYLHFYLTFYCFSFTADLGPTAGLVLFVVGSLAVVVPTPNGAGPWHFAVITMLLIYGVNQDSARLFALVVHSIQSFLVILLGMYGFLALPILNKTK